MTKIRKILERNSFTDTYYELEDFIIFERDFDKLEEELQKYIDKKIFEENETCIHTARYYHNQFTYKSDEFELMKSRKEIGGEIAEDIESGYKHQQKDKK